MEDPWGDPWAAPVTIELAPAAAAAPREAACFVEAADGPLGRQPNAAAAAAAASPWGHDDDDDAWRDAGARTSKNGVSGWGMSSGLEPLPDPWANSQPRASVALELSSETHAREDTQQIDEARTEDGKTSPASLPGAHHDAASLHRPLVAPHDTNAQDIWAAGEPAVVAAGAKTPEPAEEAPPPPGSPSAPSPGCAIGADRQEAGRQASKVQGLVEMFDGMARRGTSPTAAAGKNDVAQERLRPESALGSEESEASATRADDFAHGAETCPGSPPQVSTDEIRDDGPQSEDGLERTVSSADWHDQVPQGSKGPQQIAYPVDMSRLDEIFPSISAQPTEPPEHGPASLTGDFFTTISERKAWYRISRFGSTRRHDQGDPDDYVRVGWAASGVRERTVELVRRWVEQDSLGGRVVLGRRVGLGGGSMFNWDSAAAPVEIAELLRNRGERKTAEAHWRRASAATSDTSTTVARGNLPAAAPWPASFQAESSADQGESLAAQLAIPPDDPSRRPPVESLVGAPATLETAGEGLVDEQETDDDDDWGDMVSPTLAAATSPFEVPFADADAAVKVNLPIRESPQPDVGELSRSGPQAVDRTGKDLVKMKQVASPERDSCLGWAWGVDLVPEVIKPTPAQAPRDVELPARDQATRRSNSGADDASLLLSMSGTSTDDMMAASKTTSERRNAGGDEVVARILGGLPDLSYMLR